MFIYGSWDSFDDFIFDMAVVVLFCIATIVLVRIVNKRDRAAHSATTSVARSAHTGGPSDPEPGPLPPTPPAPQPEPQPHPHPPQPEPPDLPLPGGKPQPRSESV